MINKTSPTPPSISFIFKFLIIFIVKKNAVLREKNLLPPVLLPQSLGRLLEHGTRGLEVGCSIVEVIKLAVPLQDLVDVVPHDPDHLLHLNRRLTELKVSNIAPQNPNLLLSILQLNIFIHVECSDVSGRYFTSTRNLLTETPISENSCEKSDMQITVF